MNELPSPQRYQPPTDEAARHALALLGKARYGALASLRPDGHPLATRVVFVLDGATPVILVSGLSPHAEALARDPRCSLLVGEVPRGDPLAQPRLTLICTTRPLERTEALRARFLAGHPKAKLYIDLADFMFLALDVESATYIEGFGRAFQLTGEQLRAAAG